METLSQLIQNNTPMTEFVTELLHYAIQKHASDMHIEPHEAGYRVRYRQQGLLFSVNALSLTFGLRVIARLKVLSELDIAERRLPQDGRFTFEADQAIDCRVSTCPTMRGEKMAVRFFRQSANTLTLDALCLETKQINHLLHALQQPQGMIVMTGPTGSGKTQTLYTLLSYLNQTHRNLITIEDPVEMTLQGINQIQINPKIGLTFSHILRTILRQDPDVIMLGEIRDSETAKIAIQAAQTGHLVLSTLHTRHTAQAVTRLIHLGVDRFDIASAVTLVVAQRLIPCLCQRCQGQRCSECGAGYIGRQSIFEVMPISKPIQHGILAFETEEQLMHQARIEGMMTLYESGLRLVKSGLTDHQTLLSKVQHESI